MTESVIIREQQGLIMSTGCLVRPPDPNEDKYRLARTMPPRAVDLSVPKLLSNLSGVDYRTRIENQGRQGSCAAMATTSGAEMCAKIAGRTSFEELHFGWLYKKAREMRGWGNVDSGSYPADNCDIAMRGVPKLSLAAYIDNASYTYPASLDADAPNQDYLLSHRPFYPSEGNVLENIWTALDAKMPVIISMYWPDPFFSPQRGILPSGVRRSSNTGAHAIIVWGIAPRGDGTHVILCANSWSAGWAADAPGSGWTLRPGDFAIPSEYFMGGRNAIVFECRALSLEPFTAPPPPVPTPRITSITPTSVQAGSGLTSIQIAGSGFYIASQVFTGRGGVWGERRAVVQTDTAIRAELTAEDVAQPGAITVVVMNERNQSNDGTVTVTPAPEPEPEPSDGKEHALRIADAVVDQLRGDAERAVSRLEGAVTVRNALNERW